MGGWEGRVKGGTKATRRDVLDRLRFSQTGRTLRPRLWTLPLEWTNHRIYTFFIFIPPQLLSAINIPRLIHPHLFANFSSATFYRSPKFFVFLHNSRDDPTTRAGELLAITLRLSLSSTSVSIIDISTIIERNISDGKRMKKYIISGKNKYSKYVGAHKVRVLYCTHI